MEELLGHHDLIKYNDYQKSKGKSFLKTWSGNESAKLYYVCNIVAFEWFCR